MRLLKNSLLVFGALCALGVAKDAAAAGFYIQEQSPRAQGEAFAGAAANPVDASSIFYNPAGMTSFGTAQASAEVSLIIPHASYSDRGTTGGLTALGPGGQVPLTGNNGGNPFSATPVPSGFAASPFMDGKFWLGLAISAPFGLSNEYNSGWIGRYDSTSSDLRTLDISPVVAVKLNDKFSIGGGPDFQHMSATLDNALPCPNVGVACGAVFSPTSDGAAHLDGDSWAVGYNVGVMFNPDDATHLGLHYRSAITQGLSGTATVAGLAGGLAGANGTQGVSADVKLPAVLEFGAARDVSKQLKILGSANWFGWHRFNQILVTGAGGPVELVPENYNNTYSLAVGAEWKQDDKLTFRGGLQFDKTPTDDAFRDTRVPDSNRFWVSLGGSYAVTPNFSVDAAATHIFMPDGSINRTDSLYTGTGAATTVVVNGSSANHVDIVSLQGSLKF